MVHLNNHGGVHVETRGEKLARVLEALVAETGHCGPFILGSTHCSLCGHIAHQIEACQLTEAVNELEFKCERCGLTTVTYLDLNGEPNE